MNTFEIKMKISKNKKDYIFCISKDPYTLEKDTGNLVAYITPSNFFYEKGCMYDQHLPIKIPGWYTDSEGIFSPEKEKSEEILKNELIAQGFEWSEDFDKFINHNDDKSYGESLDDAEDAYKKEFGRPPIDDYPISEEKKTSSARMKVLFEQKLKERKESKLPKFVEDSLIPIPEMFPHLFSDRTSIEIAPGIHRVSSSRSIFANKAPLMTLDGKSFENIPLLPMGKIGTAECKKLIVDLIIANKDFTIHANDLFVSGVIEGHWKRISKRKIGRNNLREFTNGTFNTCIIDDGTNIISVEIKENKHE